MVLNIILSQKMQLAHFNCSMSLQRSKCWTIGQRSKRKSLLSDSRNSRIWMCITTSFWTKLLLKLLWIFWRRMRHFKSPVSGNASSAYVFRKNYEFNDYEWKKNFFVKIQIRSQKIFPCSFCHRWCHFALKCTAGKIIRMKFGAKRKGVKTRIYQKNVFTPNVI